jgi:flagellar protein FlgJ
MEIKGIPGPVSLAPQPRDQAAELRRAAEGFEEIFLGLFLKSARSASLGEDILGSSAVDRTRDMFDAEIARAASARSRLGIAEAVERQFTPYVSPSRKAD